MLQPTSAIVVWVGMDAKYIVGNTVRRQRMNVQVPTCNVQSCRPMLPTEPDASVRSKGLSVLPFYSVMMSCV